ncbi:unnamed protein product, partial [Iphiclides podalirius]
MPRPNKQLHVSKPDPGEKLERGYLVLRRGVLADLFAISGLGCCASHQRLRESPPPLAYPEIVTLDWSPAAFPPVKRGRSKFGFLRLEQELRAFAFVRRPSRTAAKIHI